MSKSCATSLGGPCLVPRSNGPISAGSPPHARCPGSAIGSDSTATTLSAGRSCNRPHEPNQPEVAGEADLGYRLLRRHWRRGYAAEGARELIRYRVGYVALNRIFAQYGGRLLEAVITPGPRGNPRHAVSRRPVVRDTGQADVLMAREVIEIRPGSGGRR
jgi:hypothetical protein